jgi:hypothetical protein
MKSSKQEYPSHLIDPKQKDKKWILKYIKAAYNEFIRSGYESFYNNRNNYHIIKSYAEGRQSINKYKPLMGEHEDATTSHLNIDWSILPILRKYRNMAISKLSKIDYTISANPLDPLAQDEKNSHFAKMRGKLKAKEDLGSIPGLAENPLLQMKEGEPEDIEELKVQENYTWKHSASIEMENAIDVVFHHNKMEQIRKACRGDWFDFGVSGVREYIDSNGAVKIRKVNPRSLIVSYCTKNDFSDATHIGEVIEMTIADLKQLAGNQFTSEEYREIADSHTGQLGNSHSIPESDMYNKGYDDFKIKVLDMEFLSVNTMVHEKRIDKRKNKRFGRTNYYAKDKKNKEIKRTSFKVLYRGFWIIGTDYCFNCGLATDMKRAKDNLTDTTFCYHLQALDLNNMCPLGYMEGAMPVADNIQINWYKFQSAVAEARPKGIMIEMGALEDIPLGQGGTSFTPMQVLDLFNKKGVLIYRKVDISGKATNYRPIEELQNGLGSDALNYFALIQQDIQLLRDILGLNELTDGSTPDARTLNYVAELATQGTNNALSLISDADRFMIQDVASDIVLRIQDTIKNNPTQGYVRALGSSSMKFFKASPSLNSWNYGIEIDLKATEEQKRRLVDYLNLSIGKEKLEMEDVAFIEFIDNIKQAYQVLSYRIKKRRVQRQAEEMERQQMNAQVQIQSSQAAEQSKQQTMQVDFQFKAELEKLKAQNQEKLLQMKIEGELAVKQLELGVHSEMKMAELESNEYRSEQSGNIPE